MSQENKQDSDDNTCYIYKKDKQYHFHAYAGTFICDIDPYHPNRIKLAGAYFVKGRKDLKVTINVEVNEVTKDKSILTDSVGSDTMELIKKFVYDGKVVKVNISPKQNKITIYLK